MPARLRRRDTSAVHSVVGNNRRTKHRRLTMKASFRRMRYGISLLLALVGVSIWLTLPNLRSGEASVSHTARGAAQSPAGAGLDGERRAALDKLLAEFNGGASFSEEEASL